MTHSVRCGWLCLRLSELHSKPVVDDDDDDDDDDVEHVTIIKTLTASTYTKLLSAEEVCRRLPLETEVSAMPWCGEIFIVDVRGDTITN